MESRGRLQGGATHKRLMRKADKNTFGVSDASKGRADDLNVNRKRLTQAGEKLKLRERCERVGVDTRRM